jgi:hypothetical protein
MLSLDDNYKHVSDNPNHNIKALLKKYGDTITIDDIEFKIHHSEYPNGVSYYTLYHNDSLVIDFINYSDAHAKRDASVSGKSLRTMIKFVIKLCKKLGCKHILLQDAVNVIDLSLIAEGRTYFMKYGFKLDIRTSKSILYKYKKNKDLEKHVMHLIKKIREVKVADLGLESTKGKYLWKYMVELADKNPADYAILEKDLLSSATDNRKYARYISELVRIKDNYTFILKL